MTTVAVVVVWDEQATMAARRAEVALQSQGLAVHVLDGRDNDLDICGRLREDLRSVEGGVTVPFVHLASGKVDDHPVNRFAEALRAEYFGLVYRQALVVEIERSLEEAEEAAARALLGRLERAVGAFFVSRSTEAAYEHTAAEQSGFAGDIATWLLLGRHTGFEDPHACWYVGTTSVHYRREELVRHLVARHTADALERGVLAEPSRHDASYDRGRQVAEGWDLAGADVVDEFARDPTFGTVTNRALMAPIQLDDVPLRHWLDRLASLRDLHELSNLHRAHEQVDANAREISDEWHKVAERGLREVLRDGCNLPVAIRFGEGMADAVAEAEEELRAYANCQPSSDPSIETERELRHRITHFPHGAGFLVRSAIIVLGLLAMLTGLATSGSFSEVTVWSARVLATIAGGLTWAWYAERRRRLVMARDRHIDALNLRLEGMLALRLCQQQSAAMLNLVRRLRSWVSSLEEAEAALSMSADRLRQEAEHRATSALPATRYARALPAPEDIPTDRIIETVSIEGVSDLPCRLVNLLFANGWRVDDGDVDDAVAEVAGTVRIEGLWHSLEELLADSITTRARAALTLGEKTVPRATYADRRPLGAPVRGLYYQEQAARRLSDLLVRGGDHPLPDPDTGVPLTAASLRIDPDLHHWTARDLAMVVNTHRVFEAVDGDAPDGPVTGEDGRSS